MLRLEVLTPSRSAQVEVVVLQQQRVQADQIPYLAPLHQQVVEAADHIQILLGHKMG